MNLLVDRGTAIERWMVTVSISAEKEEIKAEQEVKHEG